MSGKVYRDKFGNEEDQLGIVNHTDYELDVIVTDMRKEKKTDVEDNSTLWMWVAKGKVGYI